MSPTIAMVIAQQGFRDEEYWVPKIVFEKRGCKVVTVSSSVEPALSKFGKTTSVDISLGAFDSTQADVLLLVGGPGCRRYFDDASVHHLAREFFAQGKWVTAICSASVILARAGLLKGKNATVFPDDAPLLEAAGAVYTGQPVEKDGRLITASGPDAAESFAQSILNSIQL